MDPLVANAANNVNVAAANAQPPAQVNVQPQVQAGQNNVPVANAANPIFALSPARVNPNAFIDYSTASGQKLFSKVTAYLEYTFDVEEESIQTFIETLTNRAVMAGWNAGNADILTIAQKNLLSQHGTISLQEVRNDAITYVDQHNRKAQNSYQMYVCIMASLSDVGRAKILTEGNNYTVNGIYSGPLLFKVLMIKASTDTRATVTFIRLALTELDTYMTSVNSDIEKFNQYVRQKQQDLLYRGEDTQDLYANLFKGYMACSDGNFKAYIQRVIDRYNEGENMTINHILSKALTKYMELKQAGSWNKPTPDQEKILALTASFEALKDKNLKLSNSLIKRNDTHSNRKKDKNAKQKQKSKSKQKSKIKDEKDYAWKKVPPSNNDATTKNKDGKTYHWCEEHMAWTLHTPQECKLRIEREKGIGQTSTNLSQEVSKALQVILEE